MVGGFVCVGVVDCQLGCLDLVQWVDVGMVGFDDIFVVYCVGGWCVIVFEVLDVLEIDVLYIGCFFELYYVIGIGGVWDQWLVGYLWYGFDYWGCGLS